MKGNKAHLHYSEYILFGKHKHQLNSSRGSLSKWHITITEMCLRNCQWHIRADATFYCLFMLCLDIVYNLYMYADDICLLLNPAIQG